MHYDLFDPESSNYDAIVAGKKAYLNKPFFLIRAAFYLLGWNLYAYFSRKYSLALDETNDISWYRKNFKIAAGFLAFYIVTESMMSWDWLMSFVPHWFSTLYGWYLFAGMMVTGMIAIVLLTIFLKNKGYLDFINDSHIHDLAKYIFAFSIFWTYLWFSQFMLIWYANIPEEASYFVLRLQNYKLSFLLPLILNFVFPILILMSSDFKRIPWFTEFVGIVLLIGHYMSLYNMVVPSTVGLYGSFGIPEIAGLIFFLGLFILIVGTALGKVPLKPEGSPYMKESENFEY